MVDKPKYLLPSVENRPCRQGVCVVTIYPLSDRDPEEGAWDLREGLARWDKAGSGLVVLDIARGEPVWLKWVLERCVGLGAPLAVVPKGTARLDTLNALRAARSPDSDSLARDCGYDA